MPSFGYCFGGVGPPSGTAAARNGGDGPAPNNEPLMTAVVTTEATTAESVATRIV